MKEHSLDSSATPAAKAARRHSNVIGSGKSAKPIKRTKTANVTYGSSKNMRVSDTGNFDALRGEELPGTLQTNFANHEPTVMFRDTGSTVADNESSQQRMVEQTINQSKQFSDAANHKPVDSDKVDSSPFPWAESSVPTQTPGDGTSKQSPREEAAEGSNSNVAETAVPDLSNVSQQVAVAVEDMEVHPDTAEPVTARSPQVQTNEAPVESATSRKQTSTLHSKEAGIPTEHQSHSPKDQPPLHSSPQVSVPRVRVKSTTQASNDQHEVPKSRKRKASAASLEPLNSEDRAIGHPKELYQPRPSRRRATGVVEQPQDFSVILEKAAKRRRKTANTAPARSELAEDELAHDPAPISKIKAGKGKLDESATKSAESRTSTAVPAMEGNPLPNRGEVRALLKDLNFPLTNTSFDASKEEVSPTKDASPLSAKKVPATASTTSMPPPASPSLATSPTKRLSNAAAAFAMPPPSSSATRTSRRSHTTIFEDHVDFGGSQQRSPSLRQQQADRKSAVLKEVKNVPTQATRRKRRSIVQDDEGDDDDEDELVKEPVAEAPVPKKRGRPAKAPAAKKPSPADRVLQDSDADPDDEEEDVVEPPKKKGRPAKSTVAKSFKSADKVMEDSEDDCNEPEVEDEEPPKKKSRGRPSKAAVVEPEEAPVATADADKPRSRRASATSNPPATPPPDKQTPPVTNHKAAAKAAAQTKVAPATHTPIKTSSKVIHRVGLNRRQRVQPLLKMVRPPAPAAAPTKKR